MGQLEGHLAEAHKQTQRLLKRQAELGGAMAEFGASMAVVAAFDSAPLDQAFQGLSARSAAISSLCQVRSSPALWSWLCSAQGVLITQHDLAGGP